MAKIDWLSFTIPRTHNTGNPEMDLFNQLSEQVERGRPTVGRFVHVKWQRGIPRKPYNIAYSSAHGATAFMRGDDILIELSGKGCDAIAERTLMELVAEVKNRVSRIDIAADFEVNFSPQMVATKIPVGRFTSRNTIVSDTGETVYIGSRKSDQYLRIYRYAKPHPRHELLRVEYVARKKIAKAICKKLETCSIDEIYAWVVDKFSLPEVVGNDCSAVDVQVEVYNKNATKTMLWLIKSVAPAMRKLIASGDLDIHDFIKTYVVP